MECPECGCQKVEVEGEALVICTVEEWTSVIDGEQKTDWTQWEVIDAADLTLVRCDECGHEGDPEEFGL